MPGIRSTVLVLYLAAAGCATTGGDHGAATANALRGAGKPALVQADLLGAPARALDDLLGRPALVRREGPGEFRRYAFEACALIVILYPDEQGALAARSLAAAAKTSGEPTPDLDLCLGQGPARAS